MTCSDLACGDHIVPPQSGRPPVGLATVGGWSRGAAARLSPEQRERLRLVATGLTHDEIAERQGVSRTTVSASLGAFYRRMGADSAAHAVAIAMRAGLIS